MPRSTALDQWQLCRVHPEMEGFVIVLSNPYYAVSDKDLEEGLSRIGDALERM